MHSTKLSFLVTAVSLLCIGAAITLANPTPLFPRLLDTEKSGLLFTVEEEKLAYDVYTQMNSLWGTQTKTFGNIMKAEAKHADAVRRLLTANGLPDPTLGKPLGVFGDAELQTLYDSLMAKGALSLKDALEVGVTIEETDIADLDRLMAETVDPAILRVYSNLKKGSTNHLAAFNRALGLNPGSKPAGKPGKGPSFPGKPKGPKGGGGLGQKNKAPPALLV
jgi:hypothetical protein